MWRKMSNCALEDVSKASNNLSKLPTLIFCNGRHGTPPPPPDPRTLGQNHGCHRKS